jgi:hypothetical protein
VNVHAEVVDIRGHTPHSDDVFLVDTNVWKWIAYTKASATWPPLAKAVDYPEFIRKARAAGSTLLHCGLSLSELANIIERYEFSQYATKKGITPSDNERKTFRRDPWHRGAVTGEIDAAWGQVQGLSTLAPLVVDHEVTGSCLKYLTSCVVDAYDGFLVEAANRNGGAALLTDDSDLCSVPGVRIFTANYHVVKSAKAVGKLVTVPRRSADGEAKRSK